MKKIELTKQNMVIMISVIIALIALGIYLIFYAPLMKELRARYLECRAVENEVADCRDVIESAGKVYGERVLMTERELSQAIDELTRQGKLKGINFISISPNQIRKDKDSQYKILPIEMEIKSSYEKLGAFLGSLDELSKGLVKVKDFDIVPDEEDASRLSTDLVVDMYFSRRESAE